MTIENIGTVDLRSSSMRSKSSYEHVDAVASRCSTDSFVVNESQQLPVRSMKRMWSDAGYFNKRNRHTPKHQSVGRLSQVASTSSTGRAGVSNEPSTTITNDETSSSVATKATSTTGMRIFIAILAVILVLCHYRIYLLQSANKVNVTRLFNSQPMTSSTSTSTKNGNKRGTTVTDINIKSLSLSSFVRPKQVSNITIPPLLSNVQCPSAQQHDNISHNKIPTFIIAGAQKSGTSALYQMLPKMQRYTSKRVRHSKKFETHFFTHHYEAIGNRPLKEDDICILRELYQHEFASSTDDKIDTSANTLTNDDIVTFEKSPIYLSQPQLPSIIYQVVPWTKLLFILRNPIDRVFSQWKMEQARNFYSYNPKAKASKTTAKTQADKNQTWISMKGSKPRRPLTSFIEMVDDEVKMLRKNHLSRAPNLSVYINTTAAQRNKVKIFRIPKSIQERVNGLQQSSPDGTNSDTQFFIKREMMSYPLSRGMYAQQLYFWIHSKYGGVGEYRIDQNIKILQYEQLVTNRSKILQETVEFLGMPIVMKHPNGTLVLPQNDIFDIDHSPGQYTMAERKAMWYNKTTSLLNNSPDSSTVGTKDGLEVAVQQKQFTTVDNIRDISTLDELLNIKMDDIVREYLYKLYQPYNDELVLQLGKEWKDIWRA